MTYSHKTKKAKSTITTTLSLNLPNKSDKVFVNNTIFYCNACGKNIKKNPLLCYIFIEYFCSQQCHIKKHKIINQKM